MNSAPSPTDRKIIGWLGLTDSANSASRLFERLGVNPRNGLPDIVHALLDKLDEATARIDVLEGIVEELRPTVT